MDLSRPVVFAHAALAVVLSWLYFRRYAMARPPIGVLNFGDVVFMVGAIIVVPLLYLALPLWLVAALLGVSALSAVYFTLEPVLRARAAIWLAALGLVAADVATAATFGATGTPFFAVNNVVLVLTAVGVTNLWAQSGMKARDVAALAAALTVYDFVATWQLPLMTDLFGRLAGLPFAPMVAWVVGPIASPTNDPSGATLWLGLGLGDLLLAAVFPLVSRKAFGRRAGLSALALALGTLAAILSLPLQEAFPVIVVLGPLIVLHYALWRRFRGRERTTREYLQAEPLRVQLARHAGDVELRAAGASATPAPIAGGRPTESSP